MTWHSLYRLLDFTIIIVLPYLLFINLIDVRFSCHFVSTLTDPLSVPLILLANIKPKSHWTIESKRRLRKTESETICHFIIQFAPLLLSLYLSFIEVHLSPEVERINRTGNMCT